MPRFLPRRAIHRLTLLSLMVFSSNLLTPLLPTAFAKSDAAKRRGDGEQSAPRTVQRNDRPVEVRERRTAASKTFRNPDGTLSTEIFKNAVHYRDGSGQFQSIDNTLVSEPDGATVRN